MITYVEGQYANGGFTTTSDTYLSCDNRVNHTKSLIQRSTLVEI